MPAVDLVSVEEVGRLEQPCAVRIRGPPAAAALLSLQLVRVLFSAQLLFMDEPMKPIFKTDQVELFKGDTLQLAPQLQPESFDAIITDPPYCSGGTTASERKRSPEDKYSQNGKLCGRPSFGGDLKDQRSFTWWCTTWLSQCRASLKEGGYCLVFIDWRQLPAMTDAFQAADLTWRGVIAWDKGPASRAPHKGYIRHQCEYVVWGTRGPCPAATHAGPFPGCYQVPVNQKDKFHLTGKPTELMRQLVRVVKPGGLILDPFAGSCTTLVAAAVEGRRAVGFEREQAYCEIGIERLKPAALKLLAV